MSDSHFVTTCEGKFYPPNRRLVNMTPWPQYHMPYSQFKFTPYRPTNPGPRIQGARQVFVFDTNQPTTFDVLYRLGC